MTITEYLANLRCTEASRLLKESAYPIEEIAAYVGYLDNNYFVKVLKKKYGLTPSEYRNQARQQKENKKDPYGSCFLNGDPRDLNPRPFDYDSL